ncbi:MAG TPA: hypothetical protein DD400_00975 [Rhodospirillaceae bacterium]|nr:hypothetical protein [Rhodospirillaceae bacterium]
MAIAQRIESLKQRHVEVKTLLHSEESRPAKDEKIIQQLKREKLTLKDEIARLTAQQQAA